VVLGFDDAVGSAAFAGDVAIWKKETYISRLDDLPALQGEEIGG
jgi:hypothetical protein